MTNITVSTKVTRNPNPTKATALPVTRTMVSACSRLLSGLSALVFGSYRLQGVSLAFLSCVTFGASLILSGEARCQNAFAIENRPVGAFADWAATSGVQVITGDFNGDFRTDIALVRQEPGWSTVPVALASDNGFTIQNRLVGEFANWAATSGVRVITGEFNGDAQTDIALVRQEPGWSTVPVALSTANGFIIENRPVGEFADWAATSGVQVITGEFNGDWRTDIALVRQEPGWSTVPVALSTANGFIIENRPVGVFADWAATSNVRVITGNFDHDLRTDIALVRQEAGWSTVPVALTSDDGFTIQNRWVGDFADWAATSGVRVITGNFNGDFQTDIALVRQEPGWSTVPVALSTASVGNGFIIENRPVGVFADWAATSNVRIITGNFNTGDFNRDFRTDIALIRQEAGWSTLPVALAFR